MTPKIRNRATKGASDHRNDDNGKGESPLQDGSHCSNPHYDIDSDSDDVDKKIEDDKEAQRSKTQIVRNLALYRFLLFSLLTFEYWKYLPHELMADLHPDNDVGSWFTYDQFELFYHWAPRRPIQIMGNDFVIDPATFLKRCGMAMGVCAALGGVPGTPYSFEAAGLLFLATYFVRFLTFAQYFTNHHYLFPLLGFLTVLSGGGCFRFSSSIPTTDGNSQTLTATPSTTTQQDWERVLQKSEWGAITLRLQYAIVYFFASLWKFHPDWTKGYICQGIFTSFDDQGVARGIPWSALNEKYGLELFQFVALGGLVLDSSMFLALALRKPSRETSRLFMTLSALFHGFVCWTMSQRIGYTFPSCCLAGSLIFYPIGGDAPTRHLKNKTDADVAALAKKDDDYQHRRQSDGQKEPRDSPITTKYTEANLLVWLARYAGLKGPEVVRASRSQRLLTLLWFLFQVGMPLRMPFFSKGSFPWTGRCYRFSWTMMLHGRQPFFVHSIVGEQDTPFEFMQLIPECSGAQLQRHLYMPESIVPFQDPRTLPLRTIMQVRHTALVFAFPRYLARVAGGWSRLMYHHNPKGCRRWKPSGHHEFVHSQVYGVLFAQLNRHGAFCRLIDPSVDLAASERARQGRPWHRIWRDVLMDKAPQGHEYLLASGIGSLNPTIPDYEAALLQTYPNATRIEYLADRVSCLAARPLALWPMGTPFMLVLLEIPDRATLQLSTRNHGMRPVTPETQWEALEAPKIVQLPKGAVTNIEAVSLEIGVQQPDTLLDCMKTTKEDLLLAFVFNT